MLNTKTATEWLADLDTVLMDSISSFTNTELLTAQDQQNIIRHLQGARQTVIKASRRAMQDQDKQDKSV